MTTEFISMRLRTTITFSEHAEVTLLSSSLSTGAATVLTLRPFVELMSFSFSPFHLANKILEEPHPLLRLFGPLTLPDTDGPKLVSTQDTSTEPTSMVLTSPRMVNSSQLEMTSDLSAFGTTQPPVDAFQDALEATLSTSSELNSTLMLANFGLLEVMIKQLCNGLDAEIRAN